jgi:hypothetical protein
LRACVEPASCTVITLTDTEIKRIHAAKSAHAVWLDKNRKLNWQLHDYTEEELRDLFAKELLFDPGGNTFFSVVDYSPSDVYRYALENGLIGSNKMNTVYLVLNDLRGNNIQTSFYHGSHDLDGDKLNTAHSLYNALTVCSPRPSNVCVRIARHGCHSMSRIIIGLLRSLNIPGQIVWNGTWFETSHSSAVWPALQHVMPHGDDIYEGSMRAVPNEEFLIPFSFYENAQNTAVCGTNKPCLSHRHHALMAMRYPAEWVEERCCNPAGFGYTSCAAYLGEDYGAYLTADELAAAVSSISGLCP